MRLPLALALLALVTAAKPALAQPEAPAQQATGQPTAALQSPQTPQTRGTADGEEEWVDRRFKLGFELGASAFGIARQTVDDAQVGSDKPTPGGTLIVFAEWIAHENFALGFGQTGTGWGSKGLEAQGFDGGVFGTTFIAPRVGFSVGACDPRCPELFVRALIGASVSRINGEYSQDPASVGRVFGGGAALGLSLGGDFRFTDRMGLRAEFGFQTDLLTHDVHVTPANGSAQDQQWDFFLLRPTLSAGLWWQVGKRR